jgi:hypothetical protein
MASKRRRFLVRLQVEQLEAGIAANNLLALGGGGLIEAGIPPASTRPEGVVAAPNSLNLIIPPVTKPTAKQAPAVRVSTAKPDTRSVASTRSVSQHPTPVSAIPVGGLQPLEASANLDELLSKPFSLQAQSVASPSRAPGETTGQGISAARERQNASDEPVSSLTERSATHAERLPPEVLKKAGKTSRLAKDREPKTPARPPARPPSGGTVHARDASPVFLRDVTYQTNHPSIMKDDTTVLYSGPQWLDLDGNGNATGPDEHQYPTSFTRDSTLSVSPTFTVDPNQLLGQLVMVRGDGPGNIDIPASQPQLVFGNQLFFFGLTAANPFPNVVTHYESFTIAWEYSVDNGTTWAAAGTSSNQLYVTYADPIVSGDVFYPHLYHTPLHISTKIAAGKSTETEVFDKIWEEFSDKVVKRVDNTPIAYYKDWRPLNDTTREILAFADGNCVGWVALFIDTYKSQGIDYLNEVIEVNPPMGTQGFLVKNWEFRAAGGTSGVPDWPYFFIMGTPDFVLLHSYNFKHTEVTPLTGIAGQSEADPASWFRNHFLVKIGGTYYDPSYGVTYPSVANFDSTKIAGFYKPELITVNEATSGVDLNGDMDMTDVFPMTSVIVVRQNDQDVTERAFDY